MKNKAISQELITAIQELMKMETLNEFHLGGGTNLALKYEYRESTDIDLFSSGIVGVEQLKKIRESLEKSIFKERIKVDILNDTSEYLSFIRAFIFVNNESKDEIRIDIMQNVRMYHPIEEKEGIRLINDLDIGSLKLLSFANRGTKKDLYDLYFLSQKYGLERLYEELEKRNTNTDISDKKDQNIFNVPADRPIENLSQSLTALGNLNNTKDLRIESNRVSVITPELIQNINYFSMEKQWLRMVQELAKKKGLLFKLTPNKSMAKKRNKGFRL